MGEFLAATAFRTRDTEALREAIERFYRENGHPVRRVEGADARDLSPDDDTIIHGSAGNWTVVTWPRYAADGPAADSVTAALATIASSVHVHDGDYWVHRLFESGRTLDRFASMPDYFAEDPDSAQTALLAATWAGRADVLAEALGVADAVVAPYLVQAPALDDEEPDEDFEDVDEAWGKAFPDDTYDRSDVWVFTDFWRRIGIAYPAVPPADRPAAPSHVLRLPAGAARELPQGTDEL